MAFPTQPCEADLAYAAGVIDSDGCICVARHKTTAGNYTYAISVQMTNIKEVMPLWFFNTFGGHVSKTVVSKQIGGNRFSSTIRWSLHCRKAADFLEAIVPYLKLKQERARAAIKLARMARRKGPEAGQNRGWRFGQTLLTHTELEEREKLARVIREANSSGNARVSMISKMEVSSLPS